MEVQTNQIMGVDDAFNKVVEWLDLNEKASAEEMERLRTSFAAAAKGDVFFMVVSNDEKNVVVCSRGAICQDASDADNWSIPEDTLGTCFNRGGLSLINVESHADDTRAIFEFSRFNFYFDELTAPENRLEFVG